jgi:A/G-specific adenine glycosylase
MLTSSALSRFRKKLQSWFASAQRDLPWRHTKDPYRIWLSEIMLQQTRVAAAIPYYNKFVEHFPDIQALAAAPEEEVLRLWAGLGYYSRARNMQKAARQIVEKYDSRFPSHEQEALALTGIGSYTAAAILSIAYGKQLAVLDGNVARVLARLGAIRGDLKSGNRWRKLQQTADTLLARRAPGDWNQAMMELGATVCTPRSPQCLPCPVGEFCEARKRGLAEEIPEKREKRANEPVALAALVLMDRLGHTLLLPPPSADIAPTHAAEVTDLLSRMWHFPTVRIERDAEAELRTLAGKICGGHLRGEFESLPRVRHAVTYRRITVYPFRLIVAKLPRVAHAKSLSLGELSSVPVSNLTHKVARAAMEVRAVRPTEGAQARIFTG